MPDPLQNFVAYMGQIAVIAAAATVLLRALPIPSAGVRHFCWRLVLATCLIAPWLLRSTMPTPQPVTVVVDVPAAEASNAVAAVSPVVRPESPRFSWRRAVVIALASGLLLRLAWLGIGLLRLRHLRRTGVEVSSDADAEMQRLIGTRASIRSVDGLAQPVTFGVLRPVVLLPASLATSPATFRRAIVTHELFHVRRRDWLWVVTEELLCAVFWFHPAIWWVLGEIGLAREQEVDRRVVGEMHSREEYVDALLSIAGAKAHLDLAPAPLFLRKRHLKHRVVSILKEVRMSKTRLISSLAAALGVLVAACWLVTSTFPLAADSADSPGITVDLGGATLLHRPPVLYPEAARKLGIQGTVVVQLKLDSSAEVSDALVVSGPDELRKEALRSVLNWHFAADAAGTTRVVSISFQADAAQTAPAPPVPPRPLQKIQVGGNVQSTKLILQPRPVYPPLAKQARIQGVVKLHALIAVDGTIADLSVIGGHPLLVPSALEAVRQWVYSPTYLNGNPTEVETEIDVNYTLAP